MLHRICRTFCKATQVLSYAVEPHTVGFGPVRPDAVEPCTVDPDRVEPGTVEPDMVGFGPAGPDTSTPKTFFIQHIHSTKGITRVA